MKNNLKKIVCVIVCIMVTIAFTVVPCFANTFGNDTFDANSYIGIDWSGIPLDKSNASNSYYTGIENFGKMYINDIDAINSGGIKTDILDSGTDTTFVNSASVYSNIKYHDTIDIVYRGAYHWSSYIHSWRNTSVMNEFHINDVRLWYDNYPYSDVLFLNLVVPTDYINFYRNNPGSIDDYINFRITYSFDYLSVYERNWVHVINSLDYGMNGAPLDDIIHDYPVWTNSICDTSNLCPKGYSCLTISVPFNDMLSDFYQQYYTNQPTDILSVYTKNLSLYIIPEFDIPMLEQVNEHIVTDYGGNSLDINIYNSLVSYDMYSNNVINGRAMNTIPIVSAFSHKPNDYQDDYDTLSHVLKDMGIDKVFVDGDVTSWLGTVLKGLFDIQLFGTISLGSILSVVLGVSLVMMIIKFFAGG